MEPDSFFMLTHYQDTNYGIIAEAYIFTSLYSAREELNRIKADITETELIRDYKDEEFGEPGGPELVDSKDRFIFANGDDAFYRVTIQEIPYGVEKLIDLHY